eukprot:1275595-Rhodomonas_salina.1
MGDTSRCLGRGGGTAVERRYKVSKRYPGRIPTDAYADAMCTGRLYAIGSSYYLALLVLRAGATVSEMLRVGSTQWREWRKQKHRSYLSTISDSIWLWLSPQ